MRQKDRVQRTHAEPGNARQRREVPVQRALVRGRERAALNDCLDVALDGPDTCQLHRRHRIAKRGKRKPIGVVCAAANLVKDDE